MTEISMDPEVMKKHAADHDLVADVREAIDAGMRDAWDATTDFAEDAWDNTTEFVGDVAHNIGKAWDGLWN